MSDSASNQPMPAIIHKPRLRSQGFSNLYRKTLFGTLALMLVTYLFCAPDPWRLPTSGAILFQVVGLALLFAGMVGRVLATMSIGGHKDRRIICTELYSVCRNPLYFASFLLAVGVGLMSSRVDFLLLVAGGFLGIFYPMMRNEARYLRERFADYVEYERSVPMFVPNFRLWKERQAFEINFRLVRRTLLDSLVVLLVVPLLIFLRWH